MVASAYGLSGMIINDVNSQGNRIILMRATQKGFSFPAVSCKPSVAQRLRELSADPNISNVNVTVRHLTLSVCWMYSVYSLSLCVCPDGFIRYHKKKSIFLPQAHLTQAFFFLLCCRLCFQKLANNEVCFQNRIHLISFFFKCRLNRTSSKTFFRLPCTLALPYLLSYASSSFSCLLCIANMVSVEFFFDDRCVHHG